MNRLKIIILGVLLMAETLMAGFTTLKTAQVQEALKNGVAVIDIRRPDEWERFGVIKGSHKLTFFDGQGRYDINGWMSEFTKIVTSKDQPFILVCAHANRTKSVGELLGIQLGYKYVQELDGGINYGWIDKGLETVK